TGCTLTNPGVSARLQYSRSTARDTWAAVVPAGTVPRSNCNSVVYPPPTFRFDRAPLFAAGLAEFTWASATSVASTAEARAATITKASPAHQGSLLPATPIRILGAWHLPLS